MFSDAVIRKNQYYDSVFLMGINNRLMKIPGVLQTAVLMGSDANKKILQDLGFDNPDIITANPNDLVVAVAAETEAARDAVIKHLDEWLTEVSSKKTALQVHDLGEALIQKPDANLVVISVPGEYAAHEARKSLEAGKNVFLFSDNVSLDDEISLKKYAREHSLLLMGPDCGTSIIGGVGIGFANKVRRGKIGAIAAAGTGLQEFTCLVHNAGFGISQAIGTGGRDLSEAVGGITTLSAMDALEEDLSTQVVVLISKPPAENTLTLLIERIKRYSKPVICCFLGVDHPIDGEGKYFQRAEIIDDAASLAIKALGGESVPASNPYQTEPVLRPLPGHNYLRGVFAGGSFCYQSQQILKKAAIKVYSNGPLDKELTLPNPEKSIENTIVDMGEEYFMVGRPHPMIDGSQRAQRILKESSDPEVGILLFDVILGYNASPDPVGELLEAIQKARQITSQRNQPLEIVASICGTEGDLQDIRQQKKMMTEAGVKVFDSNAQATEYCVSWMKKVSRE